MKQILQRKIYLCLYALLLLVVASCSDISQTQEGFTGKGEQVYVGKLDSIEVKGGFNRVIITGKNTFMRNAANCVVSWVSSTGEKNERSFVVSENTNGSNLSLVLNELAEGDYQFYVQTEDTDGNRSIAVECFGYVYGENYRAAQMPIIITNVVCDLEGSAVLSLSECEYASALNAKYVNTAGDTVSIKLEDIGASVKLPKWRGGDSEDITLITSILPVNRNGVDTLVLDPKTQTIAREFKEFDVDKTLWSPAELTADDNKGAAFGFGGPEALIDGAVADVQNQIISGATDFPIHFAFDMGTNLYLSECSVIGRQGESTWDLVKFEIWGRESLEDGPDGDTGYMILSKSNSDGFEAEAIQRGWKCVGKGWHTYESIAPPTTSTVKLTDVDDSIKPRYILFRVMSYLTPGAGGNPSFTGADGGYSNNGYFCASELSFKANGALYTIK